MVEEKVLDKDEWYDLLMRLALSKFSKEEIKAKMKTMEEKFPELKLGKKN